MCVDANDYSLDPRLFGRRVELRISQREIVAVALETGELACRHRRSFARHRTITALEHARALRELRGAPPEPEVETRPLAPEAPASEPWKASVEPIMELSGLGSRILPPAKTTRHRKPLSMSDGTRSLSRTRRAATGLSSLRAMFDASWRRSASGGASALARGCGTHLRNWAVCRGT